MMTKTYIAILTGIALLTSSPSGFAQNESQPRSTLEEIIVTARKKAEALQDTPIAIDAVTAARIEQLAIQTTDDLAKYSASLTFDRGLLPTDTRPVIRSLAAQRGRPNAGIMVDFVDVSSEALTVAGGGITSNVRLLDLERIEVVKGPQSALYGRSAFSGAVNYVTKRPSDVFEGQLEASYDEFASEARLSVTGPLNDSLAGRLVINRYDSDGWYKNPNTGGRLGEAESTGIAGSLVFNPADNLSIYTRVEHSEEEYSPRAEVSISSITAQFDPTVNFFGTGTVTDAAIQFPYAFGGPVPCNGFDRVTPYFDSFGAGPPCRPIVVGEQHGTAAQIDLSADPRTGRDFEGTDMDNTRFHLEVNLDLDNFRAQYLFGVGNNDTFFQEDFDKSSTRVISVPFVFSQFGLSAMSQQRVETDQINHEIRFSGESDSINWNISLLKWDEEMDLAFDDEWWMREGGGSAELLNLLNATVFSFLDPPNEFAPGFCTIFYPGNPDCVNDYTFIATGPGNTPAVPLFRDTDHLSLAGMVEWEINDAWTLTVEGRYLDEEINYSGSGADVSFFSLFGADPFWGFLQGPGDPTTNQVSADHFVPKVTLDWRPNDDLMIYGYYAEGFKPGGVSTTDANGDVTDGEFKSESLDVYEIGFKSDFRNDTVRLNGSAFYYDYTDQQVPFQFFSPSTNLLQTMVINAGATEVKGLELDLMWRSAYLDGLTVALSYMYTDAVFTDFNLAQILSPAGGRPSQTGLAFAGNAEGDYAGKKVPLTAEHAATMALRYDREVGQQMNGYVEILGSYQSKRFLNEGNQSWYPSRTIWDFYAGLSADRWQVTLFVENLLDDDKIQSGLSNVDFGLLPDGQNLPHATNLYLPQPRTAGLRLKYSF